MPTAVRSDMRSAAPVGLGVTDDAEPETVAARAFGEMLLTTDGPRRLDDLLRDAAVALAELVGVARCTFYVRTGRTGTFRGRVAHPRRFDAVAQRLIMGGPTDVLTADAIAAGRAISVSDVTRDARTARSAVREQHVRSVLVVPLVADGAVPFGVAYLDDLERQRDFTDADRAVASVFARLLARCADQHVRAGSLDATRDLLARERSIGPRVMHLEHRLAQVTGEGIDAILGEAASVNGHPVELLASNGTVAWSSAATDARGETRERARTILRAVDGCEQGEVRIIDPDLQLGITHRCVAAPCRISATDSGVVVLTERGTRFSPLDHILAVRTAAAVSSIVTSGTSNVPSVRADDRSVVLAHVLGEPLSKTAAFELAERHDIDVEGRRVVVALHPALSTDVAMVLGGLTDRRVVCVPYDDVLALVVEIEDLTGTNREVAASVRDDVAVALGAVEGLDPTTAVFGVSRVCGDLSGLPRALALARRLRAVGSASATGSQVRPRGTSVDDLGPAALLLVDPVDGPEFAREILGDLMAPEPAMEDLLSTVATFCRTHANIRTTAAEHNIHDNTVRHRLGRVNGLIGLDLTGALDDLLIARAAIAVLDLAGESPGSSRPVTTPNPASDATRSATDQRPGDD